MTRKFTSSEISTFRRCRRKWYLGTYLRLGLIREQEQINVARTGTLVHLGLEVWYGTGDREAAIQSVVARNAEDVLALEAAERTTAVTKANKQGALSVTMLDGYFDWLEETGADAGLEIVSAEEKLEIPVVGLPGISLLGKLDTRVRRREDGATLFVDHKTIQGSIDDYTIGLHRSSQFKHYGLLEYLRHLADKEAGLLPADTELRGTDGVIVNMLRRVGRGKTSKPPFYGREELRITVPILRTYWAQVMGEILRILEVERLLAAGGDHQELAPPNATRDCSWDCSFVAVCPMFDDGSDVQVVLDLSFEERDPLERYGEDVDDDDAERD